MLSTSASTISRRTAAARLPRVATSAKSVRVSTRVPLRMPAASNFESPQIDTEALKTKATEAFNSATTTIKTKWEETDDKPAVITITAASFVAILALNAVADAINKIPLVSNLLELVGIFATTWFTYRYLVFGPDREELKDSILAFVDKVKGK